MKSLKINFAFLALMVFAFTLTIVSCDDDHNHEEEYMVNISINSPMDGEGFVLGDSVHIHAVLTNDATIHNVKVTVENTTTGTTETLYDNHEHAEMTYTYHNPNFVPSANGDYILKVESSEHGEHVHSEMINFGVAE